MPVADAVPDKLEQITQQMMHIVQACKEEKGIIEEEFVAVWQDLKILEGGLRTWQGSIEREVSGVGGQMGFQQAITEEMRTGSTILQPQDNVIVQEVGELFHSIHEEIAGLVQKQTTNGSTLLHHKQAIITLQEESDARNTRQQSIKNMVEAMAKFMKMLPAKQDVLQHTKAIDETLSKIEEVSMGITIQMGQYKVSECASHSPNSVQAGPSYTNPSERPNIDEEENGEESYTTAEDIEHEASYCYGLLRGGAGSQNSTEDGNILQPGSPAPPPAPPASPPGPPEGQRRWRKPKVKPIKLKDPYPLKGKCGEHFDGWWVLVQTFIHDHPEKFEEKGRISNLIGAVLNNMLGHGMGIGTDNCWLEIFQDLRPHIETIWGWGLKITQPGPGMSHVQKWRKSADMGIYETCSPKYKCIMIMLNEQGPHSRNGYWTGYQPRFLSKFIQLIWLENQIKKWWKSSWRLEEQLKKWEEAKKNLGTRTLKHSEKKKWEKPKDNFQVKKALSRKEEPACEERKFVNRSDNLNIRTFTWHMEGIPQDEMNEQNEPQQCMICAWPADRKGSHKTMECYRPAKTDAGTANFPKAKEYQKVKIRAHELEEDQRDLYMEGASKEESSSEELWNTALEESEEGSTSTSESGSGSLEAGANWWESD